MLEYKEYGKEVDWWLECLVCDSSIVRELWWCINCCNEFVEPGNGRGLVCPLCGSDDIIVYYRRPYERQDF